MGAEQKGGAGFAGTTYEEVQSAQDLQELVCKLYEFGLRSVAPLPRRARQEDLEDALSEFTARFLESAAEARLLNPEASEFDCALETLARLRRSEAQTRIYTRPGFRMRIKQEILKKIQPQHHGAVLSRFYHEPEAAPSEETEEVLSLAEIPEQVLAQIEEWIRPAWHKVKESAFQAIREQTKTARRRQTIVELYAEQAERSCRYGVVADHLATVLEATPPRALIAGFRQRFPRDRVSDKVLRGDIGKARQALLARIDVLRAKEYEIRRRLIAKNVGLQLKSTLEAGVRRADDDC